MRERSFTATLVALFSAVGLLGCGEAPEQSRRPDIVLLIVDTLRADHLGVYGYARPTSPSLDRFAQSATVFENPIAPSSWTLPSVASLMTGTYPSVHGLRARKGGVASTSVRQGLTTLAEALSDAGYRTVAAVGNPWLTTDRGGLTSGYDRLEKLNRPSADELHAFGRASLEESDGRPTFLYLHYMDVHGPYNVRNGRAELGALPDRYLRKLSDGEREKVRDYFAIDGAAGLDDYVEAYDQGIREWDDSFGAFVTWLEENDRLEQTVVLVVSDHGEEFLEHGDWNHGLTLFQEQLFVPFVLRVPGRAGARVADRPVSLIDVGPTLLAFAGAEPPSTMLGVDVLADGLDASRALFSETDIELGELAVGAPQRAMLRGSQKWLTRPVVAGANPRRPRTESVYFDLSGDPGELEPVARGTLDAARQAAFDELEAWEARMREVADALGDTESFELSEEEANALKGLGYAE